MLRASCVAVAVAGWALMGPARAGGEDADVPAPLAAAHQECAAAVRKAEADFIRAEIAAKQRYLTAVEAALKGATKAANLELANAINEQKTSTEQEIAELKDQLVNGGPATAGASKEPTTLTIDAKQGWQTVVHLKKGQVVHLRAEGVWHTYGPDAYACDAEGIRNGKETYPFTKIALPGALIGKIGEATFLVGKAARVQAPEEGDLQVRINKKDEFLHDDSGQMKLTVRRGDAGPADKSEHQIK